jgi:hypothetical protein
MTGRIIAAEHGFGHYGKRPQVSQVLHNTGFLRSSGVVGDADLSVDPEQSAVEGLGQQSPRTEVD